MTEVGTMTEKKRHLRSSELAPVEPGVSAPAAEKRRPDPRPLQRAWGAAGAAASSALLAAIVGPMVAAAGDGGFSLDAQPDATTTGVGNGSSGEAAPTPNYIYLQPGESAPEGAPVVQLDPITVVASPQPGSSVVQPKPKRQVIYLYLKPGQTPPPGAIVQQAGTVAVATQKPTATTTPASGGGSGGSSATPKPATPPPAATPKPTSNPTPPPTKPSGP
jgi:translation initiation factor IF-3